MNHLSPAEFVEASEGALDPRRAGHLDGCAACRDQVASLSETLWDVRAAEAPEPSPIFWERFSARVRDAVASESIGTSPFGWIAPWGGARGLIGLAAAAAVAFAVLSPTRTVPTPVPLKSAHGTSALIAPDLAVEDAEVWAVLTAAAADMKIDDAQAAGLGVRPDAVARAVQDLSAEELNELGRLLQTELNGSGD